MNCWSRHSLKSSLGCSAATVCQDQWKRRIVQAASQVGTFVFISRAMQSTLSFVVMVDYSNLRKSFPRACLIHRKEFVVLKFKNKQSTSAKFCSTKSGMNYVDLHLHIFNWCKYSTTCSHAKMQGGRIQKFRPFVRVIFTSNSAWYFQGSVVWVYFAQLLAGFSPCVLRVIFAA